jgi:uncharacterized protein DUF6894
MPRYFFHLRFGRRFLPDDEGIELRNRTAARDEALAVVRDLTNKVGRQRWASWFLEVADDRSGFFRTPIGHPALELVTPDRHAPDGAEPELRPVRAESTLPEGSPRRGPDGRDYPAESGAPPMERAIAERKSPAAERAFILAPGHGSPPGPHPTPSVTRARAGSAPFGGVCDDYLGPVRLRLIRGFAPRHQRQSSLLPGRTELSPDRASARSSAVATGPVTRAAYLPCLGWICCCCWTTGRTTLASWQ